MTPVGTMTMETGRLRLRRFRLEDAQDMFDAWASDPEVTRFLTWKAHESVEVTKRILATWVGQYGRDDVYHWCVADKDTGRAVGDISVVELDESLGRAMVGYCLSRARWGQGLMTEALTAVEGYLFERAGLHRIEAYHHVDNPASGRVMLKSGMTFEGVQRQARLDHDGNYCDVALYAILESDWAMRR